MVVLFAGAIRAQTGPLVRDDCSTITSPVAGKVWCFDRSANELKRWDGAAWVGQKLTSPSIINPTDLGTNTSYIGRYSGLANAVSTIGSGTPHVLIVNTDTNITTSVVCTPNIMLRFLGGKITGSGGGQYLTVQGPIDAPPSQQIFGSGLFSSTSTNIAIDNRATPIVHVGWFGMAPGAFITTASMTASSAVLTKGSGETDFTSGDVGKIMLVRGAGASGGDLRASISTYTSATQVTLGTVAGTTVSSAKAYWGAPNDAALYAATRSGNNGWWPIQVRLPAGMYISEEPIVLNGNNAQFQALLGPGSGIYDPAPGDPTHGTSLVYTLTDAAIKIQSRGVEVGGFNLLIRNSGHGIQLGVGVDIAGLYVHDMTIGGASSTSQACITVQSGRIITTSTFERLALNGCYYGFDGTGAVSLTTLQLRKITFMGAGGGGLYLSTGTHISCESCTFQSNTAASVNLLTGSGKSINHIFLRQPYFENSGAARDVDIQGFDRSNPVENVVIDNPSHFASASSEEYRFGDVRNVEIRNPVRTGGMGSDVRVTNLSGTKQVGVRIEPRDSTRAALGALLSTIHDIAGANSKGLWTFDNRSGTTLTDRSANGTNAGTLSASPGTSLQPTDYAAPFKLVFNSSTYWDAADTTDFEFGTGAGSICVLIQFEVGSTASQTILAKWDETTGAENRDWRLATDSGGKLYFRLFDEAANTYIGRKNAGTAVTAGAWNTYCAVKASGGTTNAAITLWQNGSQVDDTDDGSGTFATDGGSTAKLGSYITGTGGTKTEIGSQSVALAVILKGQGLSALDIKRLDAVLRGYAGSLN